MSITNPKNHTLEYSKVEVPNLIAYLDWTPISKWYVIKCGSKNIYQQTYV